MSVMYTIGSDTYTSTEVSADELADLLIRNDVEILYVITTEEV